MKNVLFLLLVNTAVALCSTHLAAAEWTSGITNGIEMHFASGKTKKLAMEAARKKCIGECQDPIVFEGVGQIAIVSCDGKIALAKVIGSNLDAAYIKAGTIFGRTDMKGCEGFTVQLGDK